MGNKIAYDAQKTSIRNSFPPHIVERMCDAIDKQKLQSTSNVFSKNIMSGW